MSVRTPITCGMSPADRIAGDEADDADTAPDRHVVGGVHNSGDGRLRDGPARGQRVVALVGLPEAAGEQRVEITKWIHAERPGCFERAHDVGGVGLHQGAKARLEEVQHPELVHAAAVPVGPGGIGAGRRRRISLEHGDLVPVAGEQQRSAEADHAATDHADAGHENPFLRRASLLPCAGHLFSSRHHQARHAGRHLDGACTRSGSGEDHLKQRLAVAYDADSSSPIEIITAVGELCDLVWIVDSSSDLGPLGALLPRLGTVVDRAGLSPEEMFGRGAARPARRRGRVHRQPAPDSRRRSRPVSDCASTARKSRGCFSTSRRNAKRCRRRGLVVPAFVSIPADTAAAAIATLATSLTFPAVLKPVRGYGSRDTYHVESADRLLELLANGPGGSRARPRRLPARGVPRRPRIGTRPRVRRLRVGRERRRGRSGASSRGDGKVPPRRAVPGDRQLHTEPVVAARRGQRCSPSPTARMPRSERSTAVCIPRSS